MSRSLNRRNVEGALAGAGTLPASARPTLRGHLAILRLDHAIKNVFVLPGVAVAWFFFRDGFPWSEMWFRIPLGLLAVSIVASSNYVLNEVLDAPFDREHPTKSRRPVPAGLVDVRLALAQWVTLGAVGTGLGFALGWRLGMTLLALWIMGVVYNVPPVRAKDLPFIDVLTESVNNPIRLLAGWYLTGVTGLLPPASLLVAYWMLGGFLMALKRYAEYRLIADEGQAARYRRSFEFYTGERLLATAATYASAAMLFLGAFMVRYRIEVLLGFPLVALVMGQYLLLALRDHSPVQQPEKLYREVGLMVSVVASGLVLLLLLIVDLPWLADLVEPDFGNST